MGYFEGLTNGNFKKDRDGNTIFFPWGILGKGRVLPDEQTEKKVRTFVSRYYKVSFPTIIGIGVIVGWGWSFLLFPIFVIWFYFGLKSLISDCPYSDDRLTLKEGFTNSAAGHNKVTLWVLLVFSILFVVAGIFIASIARSSGQITLGLITVIIFGLCSGAMGYMLKTKQRSTGHSKKTVQASYVLGRGVTVKSSSPVKVPQRQSLSLGRILVALVFCFIILGLLMTQRETIREYQLYLTEDRRDVSFQLTEISEAWTEKILREKFTGFPLNCSNNPGAGLGDRACALDTKSFNGVPALYISFFFSSGALQQISINIPWWRHQEGYDYLVKLLGRPTGSQRLPHAGIRLHGWLLANGGAVFYNRDKSLNPLQWNAIYWRSASSCAANSCFRG